MKKAIIVALAGVNLALVLALLLGTGTPSATAQVYGGGTDYMVITGEMAKDWDAIFVLDLSRRRLAAFGLDKTNNRIQPFGGGRDLRIDFGRKAD